MKRNGNKLCKVDKGDPDLKLLDFAEKNANDTITCMPEHKSQMDQFEKEVGKDYLNIQPSPVARPRKDYRFEGVSDLDDDDIFNSLGTTRITNQDYNNREKHVRCKYPFTNHNKLRDSKKRKRRGHQNCYLCKKEWNKYKVTCFYCSKCRVPLCNKGCFDWYHKQKFCKTAK